MFLQPIQLDSRQQPLHPQHRPHTGHHQGAAAAQPARQYSSRDLRRESARGPRQQHQQPPPHRLRTDAFEATSKAPRHPGPGLRDRSGPRPCPRKPRAQTTFTASEPIYGQPITTVTASASVTVAVHSGLPPQNPAYPAYPSPDGYQPADHMDPDPPFPDPHVPFEGQPDEKEAMEAIELQDVECEARCDGRRSDS